MVVLSACAISGSNVAGLESSASLVTGSVAQPAANAGIARTDAEIIKSVVASADLDAPSSLLLAWRNPATGSSGTITAINSFLGKHGQNCRGFKTTVATFMGIAFYNGEACQISAKEWVLSWFRRSDSES